MSLSRSTVLNASIALLAGASVVAVLATRDVVSTKDSDGRARVLLPVFRSEDVTRLELRDKSKKMAIERSASDGGSAAFQLVEPVKELADATTVEKFLSALASAHALRPVDQGPAPSTFGLDPPELEVVVKTGKRSYRLALGAPAPTPAGARYLGLRSDDGAPSVWVVGKSLADDLALDLDAFRLRSLVSVSEADVTRIGIRSSKLDLSLRRSTNTSFLIDGEPKLLAERETLRSLFFQLSRLSATRFLSASDAQAALGPDRAQIELETKDPKQTIRFDAGGTCPGEPALLVIAKHSPDAQSACAPRELEATLRLQQRDFFDRHAFSLHADEVEELDISGGASKFALLRKGSGFVLHQGADSQVELEAGNQRILELLEAQGERVENARPRELGLDPAPSSVTLRSSAARDKDVVQQVVRVGNKDSAGNLFVYREQDGAVLRVPRDQARAFAVDGTLLRSRKLTEFGLSSFSSAEIERPAGPELLRRGKNQELQLDAPPGFDPDGALSSDLIQALGSLTAERFVADRDDGSFGLAHASLSLRFAFKNGEGQQLERHLRFGDETALGVFATLDDNGPVFVLSRTVRDTCDALLINRAVFPNNTELLQSISLEARGRALRLERQGERFAAVPSQALPQEKSAELLEALANLRPEVGLHTGAPLPEEGFSKPTLTLRLTPRVGPPQTLTFGAGDSWRSTSVFYLRVSGVNATFVVAQSKVRALSDAL